MYRQSSRKGVGAGLCCNRCPHHGPWCTSHEDASDVEADAASGKGQDFCRKAEAKTVAAKSKAKAKAKGRAKARLRKAETSVEDSAKRRALDVPTPLTPAKRPAAALACSGYVLVPGPVAAQCSEVVAAIRKAEDLPDSCRTMLAEIVVTSLAIPASERHALQVQGVKMLTEAIAGILSQLQDAVTQAQTNIDSVQERKEACEDAVADAQAKLSDLERNASELEAPSRSDKRDLDTAAEHLSTVQDDLDRTEKQISARQAQRAELQSTMKDVFAPLKESGAHGAEGVKSADKLIKIFTDVGLNWVLVTSVLDVLKKEPESRGSFGAVVLEQVEQEVAKFLEDCDRSIPEAEQRRDNLADLKMSAESARTLAVDQFNSSSSAFRTAQVALSDGNRACLSAESARASLECESASAARHLEQATLALATFVDGPLKSLSALKDLSESPVGVADVPEDAD